ncbi:MAG: hypothetical protein NTX61_18770 [Bacteroidetes bacterium]|nr:hypothetical protein [Bacteroidota bacterium]
MMKDKLQYIDIEIDKLTRSIENRTTGDNFQTDVLLLDSNDLKSITKSHSWLFDWKAEFRNADRDVYKLVIRNNLTIIQGVISITEREDHVYMHLIESAPFNRGKDKVYLGVPGNLVAFACKLSFHRGFEGYLSFRSKSTLLDHYEKTLGAQHIGGQIMVINTMSALKLIDKYFKE